MSKKTGIIVFSTAAAAVIITAVPLLILNRDNIAKTSDQELAELIQDMEQPTILDTSNVVAPGEISLDEIDSDITLEDEGTYKFYGSLAHTIIVNGDGDADIRIVLDDAEIVGDNTAAIVGLAGKSLTIAATEGTENLLSDSGKSQYNTVVYSKIPVILSGNGEVKIAAAQEHGKGIMTSKAGIRLESGSFTISAPSDGLSAAEGGTVEFAGGKNYIDVDGDGVKAKDDVIISGGNTFILSGGTSIDAGYKVTGGILVATGNGTVNAPKGDSTQKAVAVEYKEEFGKNTMMSLVKSDLSVDASFTPARKFKNSIVTVPCMYGVYNFYTKGEVFGGSQSLGLGNPAEEIYGVYIGGSYKIGETGKLVLDNIDVGNANCVVD